VEEQKSVFHYDWESRSPGGEVISPAEHIKGSEVVLGYDLRRAGGQINCRCL
jgi:hypothetical protein